MEITTWDFAVYSYTSWRTVGDRLEVGHLYTPQGFVDCTIFPPHKTRGQLLIGNFIFAGRIHTMWTERPMGFTHLAATRIVRKWIRGITSAEDN